MKVKWDKIEIHGSDLSMILTDISMESVYLV